MPRSAQTIIDQAARFENAEPNPISDKAQDAMHALRDAVIARGHAELAVRDAVARARQEGASWAVISTGLGTTRQAAQQRYADL